MADLLQAAERHEQLGQLDEAIAIYGQLADLGIGGGEPLIRRAQLNSERGDIQAAFSDLKRGTRVAPENPYVWMRLAHLESGTMRRIAAVQHLRMAGEAEPDNLEMKVNLASAYQMADWLDLAYAIARRLPEDVSDWWAQVRQLATESYRSERRATLDILRRRRDSQMDHGWLYDMAKRLRRLGRLQLARRLCERVIGENPEWFLPHWLVSDIIAREAGPEAAFAHLNAAFQLPPNSPDYAVGDHLEARTALLNEMGRFGELLDLLNAQPGVQPREHFRQMAAVANFMTSRDEALRRHCLTWMQASPLSPVPAGFIVLMQARNAAPQSAAPAIASPPTGVHLAQFWAQGTPPDDVLSAMESWTQRHPHWRRTTFNDDSAQAFIADRLGREAEQAYGRCYHAAMRADFFRIAYLYAEGGLYVDADEACLRPLGDILPDVRGYELLAFRAAGVPGFVDTPFLGGRQGSRVLQRVLENTIHNLELAAREGWHPTIWEVTGPGALTRGLAHYLVTADDAARERVLLLPSQQYRAYVQTQDLLYKRDARMNWRIAYNA